MSGVPRPTFPRIPEELRRRWAEERLKREVAEFTAWTKRLTVMAGMGYKPRRGSVLRRDDLIVWVKA